MKKVAIIVSCIFGGGILFVVMMAFWVIGVRNDFVRHENAIEAVNLDIQNVHASIFQQMKQQGVAVDEYGDMVIEAIEGAIAGRYGEGGMKSSWAWIKEDNPEIDPAIMEKLQQAIEAGYNKFEAFQRTKLDRVRIYKNSLEVFPDNMIASASGFPRIDVAAAGSIVTSAQTKQDFDTGELSDPGIFDE